MPVKFELKPSAARKWINCPASPYMELDRPETDPAAADEGTVAHWIAAGNRPEFNTEWQVIDKEVVPWVKGCGRPKIIFDHKMDDYVSLYLKRVQQTTLIAREKTINLSGLLGYPGAHGTPDAVTVDIDQPERIFTIQIHDLKYGFIEVSAQNNYQLLCYAWGVYHSMMDTIPSNYRVRFRLHIHQPRLDHYDFASYTLDEITPYWHKITAHAALILNGKNVDILEAGPHCKNSYCRAQAICPAFQDYVNKGLIAGDVEPMALPAVSLPPSLSLGDKLALVPIIRAWCEAIESEAKRVALIDGGRVSGFKVVLGRGGNREWGDKKQAEDLLRSMKLRNEFIYKMEVISPAQAERLSKEKIIGPKQWQKLQGLIDRREGRPQLAIESDVRPAVKLISDMDLLTEVEDIEDLIG
jgi:hypothetical protein